MKVLHIANDYYGTSLYKNLFDAEKSIGIDLLNVVPVSDNYDGRIDGDVLTIPCFNRIDRMSFFLKQRKIEKAIYNLNISDVNIIHAHTLFSSGYVAMRIFHKHKIPYVVAVRNVDYNFFLKKLPFLRNVGRKVIRNASAIIFLSPSYLNGVLNLLFPRSEIDKITDKCFIVPNGIDNFWQTNLYTERDYYSLENRVSKKRLNIIYAGEINKNKNLELTCKAIKKMAREGWNIDYTVIGRITDNKVYDSIKESIIYHTACSKYELIYLYRKADIFVMPSHVETFGLVYAEAMSQGLPVIYTRGQGFDGHFPDGFIGYAVDDNSVDDLCSKIELIIENYDKISRNCMEMASKFDWKIIVKEYERLYSKIARV